MPPSQDVTGFSSILDARVRAATEDADSGAPLPSLTRLEAALEHARGVSHTQSYVPVEALARAYGDERSMLNDSELRLYRSDLETVAGELGLSPDMTVEDLNRCRRDFALTNHPDRVPAGHREAATRRMTIANALVDRGRERQKKPFSWSRWLNRHFCGPVGTYNLTQIPLPGLAGRQCVCAITQGIGGSAAVRVEVRVGMWDPEAMALLHQRRELIRAWLDEQAPYAASDQKHLDADTPERAYWHHGYQAALTDILEMLSGERIFDSADTPR